MIDMLTIATEYLRCHSRSAKYMDEADLVYRVYGDGKIRLYFIEGVTRWGSHFGSHTSHELKNGEWTVTEVTPQSRLAALGF